MRRAVLDDSEEFIEMDGSTTNKGRRVEWTGAGGDYFLGIVVDEDERVVAEFWGTQREMRDWLKTNWPDLSATWVPMVYTPGQGNVKPPTGPPPLPRKRTRRTVRTGSALATST
jgi:hypothetical protein